LPCLGEEILNLLNVGFLEKFRENGYFNSKCLNEYGLVAGMSRITMCIERKIMGNYKP